MYIYHVLINALNTHINLNMIFYTHIEHSPTKTTHTKHHTERQTPHIHTQTTMNSNVYDADLIIHVRKYTHT